MTDRCSVCCRFLSNERRARWPGSTTCGQHRCETENRRRVSGTPEYLPPNPGEADHADPTFKPRLRDCGKPGCDRTFETTPRWRFFCPRCRQTKAVRFPEPERTYAISSGRRSGGA